jgi:uncharacterized membrane protein (DUF2068 family)
MSQSNKLITGFTLICVLGILQAILRLVFFSMMLNGNEMDMERDISNFEYDLMMAMFGLLGVAGLATSAGLWLKTSWGYYGTIAFSAITIAFDVWGVLVVQATAVMGFVFPIAFIAYLLIKRDSYFGKEAGIR